MIFRFFDSRLYEPHAARAGQLPAAHLLSFKGERGRNPARVFAELDDDPRAGDAPRRAPAAACTSSRTRRSTSRATSSAGLPKNRKIAAVFILPSGGKLDLDYLDLLDAHWVVDHKALQNKSARAAEARRILDDVGSRAPAHRARARPAGRRRAGSEKIALKAPW